MRRQVLLCTIEHDGAERAIYVGFTNALTPELAGALAQALEDLSGAESIGVLADYTNSSGAEAYRTRWLITLAALIAAMLAAAVALIVFARKSVPSKRPTPSSIRATASEMTAFICIAWKRCSPLRCGVLPMLSVSAAI